MVPPMLALAGIGVAALVSLVRRPDPSSSRRAAALLAAAACVAVLSHIPLVRPILSRDHWMIAQAYARRGNLPAAAAAYEAAVREEGDDGELLNNLALVYRRQGMGARADATLRRAIAANRQLAGPRNELRLDVHPGIARLLGRHHRPERERLVAGQLVAPRDPVAAACPDRTPVLRLQGEPRFVLAGRDRIAVDFRQPPARVLERRRDEHGSALLAGLEADHALDHQRAFGRPVVAHVEHQPALDIGHRFATLLAAGVLPRGRQRRLRRGGQQRPALAGQAVAERSGALRRVLVDPAQRQTRLDWLGGLRPGGGRRPPPPRPPSPPLRADPGRRLAPL